MLAWTAQIWYLPVPAGLVEGEFNRGTVVPCSTSVPSEHCPDPLPLALKLVNSLPPHYVLAAATPALESRLSEFVSKPVYAQPHRMNAWDPSSPLSHLDAVPAGFHSQFLCGLLFPHGEPLQPKYPSGF